MKRILIISLLSGMILCAVENKFVVTVDSEISSEILEGLIKESLTMDQLDLVDVKVFDEDELATKISLDSVEDFINYYFSGIKSRNLNTSYSYLTEEYRSRTNGKDAYINWWNMVESVTVEKVSVVDPYIEAYEKKVNVTLIFVMDDRRVITEEALFLVTYNKSLGSWQFLRRLQ